MKWSIVSNPIGMPLEAGRKKEMPIPLAVPLAMGAASLVSGLFGASKSRKAAREAARKLESEKNRVEAERRRRMNEDYLDTAAGQNLMRLAREERDRLWKREQGAAAVGGGTAAAAAMAKERGNKMVGDTIAGIAAQDSQRKDAVDSSYRSDLSRLTQQQIAADQAKSQAIADAASGASNVLLQGAMTTFGGTKIGQEWMGTGSPGGGGVSTQPKIDDVGGSNDEWMKKYKDRLFDSRDSFDYMHKNYSSYVPDYWQG